MDKSVYWLLFVMSLIIMLNNSREPWKIVISFYWFIYSVVYGFTHKSSNVPLYTYEEVKELFNDRR